MAPVDREKIFWRKIGEETFVSNMETGQTYSLDETAAFIWDKMLTGQDPTKIISFLTEAYSIDEQTARQDLEALLVDFQKEGLIQ